MGQRGITLEAMKDVVKYPHQRQKQYRGIHGGTVFRFSKVRAGVKVTVVAEMKTSECWLLTCFYE
jgi:hypothetical protein